MKTLGVSLLVLIGALSARAEVQTDRWTIKGDGAEASSGTCDECGCRDFFLHFSEEATRVTGYAAEYGYFGFSNYNWCTNESSYGSADLTGATFDGSGARGATLTASGTAFEEVFLGCEFVEGSGEEICEEDDWGSWCWIDEGYWDCHWDYVPVPYSIDLTWAPTDTQRGTSNNMWKSKYGMARYRQSGTTGYGPVTGSVQVDGEERVGDFSYGSCWSVNAGSVSIWRY